MRAKRFNIHSTISLNKKKQVDSEYPRNLVRNLNKKVGSSIFSTQEELDPRSNIRSQVLFVQDPHGRIIDGRIIGKKNDKTDEIDYYYDPSKVRVGLLKKAAKKAANALTGRKNAPPIETREKIYLFTTTKITTKTGTYIYEKTPEQLASTQANSTTSSGSDSGSSADFDERTTIRPSPIAAAITRTPEQSRLGLSMLELPDIPPILPKEEEEEEDDSHETMLFFRSPRKTQPSLSSLITAVKENKPETVITLLTSNPTLKKHLDEPDEKGKTVMDHALESEHTDNSTLIFILLNNGAQPKQEKSKQTLLGFVTDVSEMLTTALEKSKPSSTSPRLGSI